MPLERLAREGLYDPRFEHDNCGIGMIAHLDGHQAHSIIEGSLKSLEHLAHRGACGCDPDTGDGCGILIQIPEKFFAEQAEALSFALPEPEAYGVGMIFFPQGKKDRDKYRKLIEKVVEEERLELLGWREVPRNSEVLGWLAREAEPVVEQVFVTRPEGMDTDGFERRLYIVRKRVEHAAIKSPQTSKGKFYIPSMSARTIVYKGLMNPDKLGSYYLDLADPSFESGLALYHQRFSTNTLPAWPLAQPFRFLCHNGEINTLRGNFNMMRSRESQLNSPFFEGRAKHLAPIMTPGISDSAGLDEVYELLVRAGRHVDRAMMMMTPEPWGSHDSMPDDLKAFYEYQACLMEPWDGPASIPFTDGKRAGAVLDRNGLRPSRYWLTKNGLLVMGSEVGILDIPQNTIIRKGRLQPGRMFLIDTEEGRIIEDEEIKRNAALNRPYRAWLDLNRVTLPEVCPATNGVVEQVSLMEQQQIFGFTREDIEFVLKPMCETGKEPTGSMGNDTPLAVLSYRPQLLFNYFKQLFAQVTNPPIDPIREEIVMSLETDIGWERNLLDETPAHAQRLHLMSPIITDEQLDFIKNLNQRALKTKTISTLFKAAGGTHALDEALDRICHEASIAIDEGYTIIVLSDRGVDQEMAPLPSLMAVGGVHHHLIREQKRTRSGLVIETGEAREVMHFCLLTGYGAGAVNPYLAFETIRAEIDREEIVEKEPGYAQKKYFKALEKGLLKTMSKIGISTQHSYRSAQIFEAVGIGDELIERCFAGTPSRVAGIGIEEVARETLMRHAIAYPQASAQARHLDPGGNYQWRRRGEFHMINPSTVAKLQHATSQNSFSKFQEFSDEVNNRNRGLATLRGLMKFAKGKPIPIEEVEPAKDIVKRFCSGAMSYGAISWEAHTTLAIAMNRIGGRSNTGEGGEDPIRFPTMENGDSMRSAIKQVASGRFGVTNEYLVNADELQIKMAQGAKPGEGGQLPGHKVFGGIAKCRFSTPGVELVSPPPHHDIYSIEDLAQLIHDLKNANVNSAISVKLVSAVGVGTIAAGVAKGKADLVLISGHEGGTGASPISSIKHAGLPWELGLAETHQVLVTNNLRSRIRVQTDGQLKTGRDATIAFLLGADEVGFATVPLIVEGCIMMRKCHLNTCPVGVATQDPELRAKFKGKPEHVVNYFFFVAEEIRAIMANLGFRNVSEMIGRADMLEFDPMPDHWKAKTLKLDRVLKKVDAWEGETLYCSKKQDHGIEKALDNQLIRMAEPALRKKVPVRISADLKNVNRSVGTMLSSALTRAHGLGMYAELLDEDTVWIDCKGQAGQSFGAFSIQGVTLNLEGEANDYVGKGLSGGKIIVRPPQNCPIVPENNVIVGNVVCYGATSGEVYLRGMAGERFCVRNSGAWAVVEGVGDHGCEYMTGGRVAILGKTGRNFAAGMSGGIAFVYDEDDTFTERCNLGMVKLRPLHAESIPELDYLLRRHVDYTRSTVALAILDNWETSLRKFVRVMPIDYSRVLSARQAREAEEMSHVPE